MSSPNAPPPRAYTNADQREGVSGEPKVSFAREWDLCTGMEYARRGTLTEFALRWRHSCIVEPRLAPGKHKGGNEHQIVCGVTSERERGRKGGLLTTQRHRVTDDMPTLSASVTFYACRAQSTDHRTSFPTGWQTETESKPAHPLNTAYSEEKS